MIARIREFIKSSLEAYWYRLFAAGFVFRRGLPRDMREKEFEEIYNACKAYTMTSPERMYALYKSVTYVIRAGIPGDFVECGVWRGGSAMLIVFTLLRLDTDLYESTIHELRYLFPLLAQHGVVLIDDYGCFQGAKEAVDTYIYSREQH